MGMWGARVSWCASAGSSTRKATLEGGHTLLEHDRRLAPLFLALRARQESDAGTELPRDLQTGVGVEGRKAFVDLPLGVAAVRPEELVSKPLECRGHGRKAAAQQREVRTEVREVEVRITEANLVEVDRARSLGHEDVLVMEVLVDGPAGLGSERRRQLREAAADAICCPGPVGVPFGNGGRPRVKVHQLGPDIERLVQGQPGPVQ